MKRFLALIFALMTVVATVGCGAQEAPSGSSDPANSASGESPEKTYTMRIGHILDTDSLRHQSLEMFAKEVKEKTNGGIDVQLFPSAQLGTDDELVEQVKNGALEGYRGSAIDTVIPEYNFYSMPFLFANADEAVAVMNSDWGKKWAEHSSVNNVKILSTGVGGFRVLTNNKHAVHTPADMQGIKLRVPSWDVTIRTMEALGVDCTSIAYNETYMALKTNVADGQENPWVYIVEPKFYEVQKYATALNWNVTLEYFPINLEWFNSLPTEYQEILLSAAEDCMNWFNEKNVEMEQGYIDTCAQSMEITYLTDEEHQQFVDATASVYDYYIETGLFTQADLDEVRSIIAATK